MSEVTDELEIVREFVNTAELGSGSDQLDAPSTLLAWLAEHALIEEGATASKKDLERTRALRDALRALLYANSGGELDPKAPPVLDAAAARADLRLRFGGRRRCRPDVVYRGRERGARAPARDRRRGDASGNLGPAQGLSQRRLPLGLLRRLQESLPRLVLDGPVREPGQGPSFSRAT